MLRIRQAHEDGRGASGEQHPATEPGAPGRPAGDGGPAERPRVILADPDPLARRVVRDLLQQRGVFLVVAEVGDGVELVELAVHYRPELVLVEPNLPRLGGLDAVRRVREKAPDVRLIVFSIDSDPELQLNALRAGASGFVPKSADIGALVKAMEAVVRGEAAISRLLTTRLVEHLRAMPQPGQGMRPVRSVLTTREWEVLDLMIGGARTAEIASVLVLTEDTVYSHIKNIMRKLGVHSRQEAVEAARRMLSGPDTNGCSDGG